MTLYFRNTTTTGTILIAARAEIGDGSQVFVAVLNMKLEKEA